MTTRLKQPKPEKTLIFLKIERSFRKFLEEKGYLIKEIPADGNCLFRSIAHQLAGDDCNHNFYRSLAVVHMKARKSHFEGFIYDFGFDGTFEEYLNSMAEDGEWGGQNELVALSTVLNCKIILLKETKETIVVNTSQNNNDTKTLHLAFYQKKSHYFSLVKNDQRNEPHISAAEEIEARKKILVKTNDQSSSKLRTKYANKNSNHEK